jgi:glutathione S-transferase
LAESSAILFHLARGTKLLPDDPLAQTRVLQWLCFEQTNVDGVISRARFRKAFPAVIPTRPEEFESWWRDGYRALDVLEKHLSHRLFLVGDRYSIADISLYAYVHCAHEGGFELRSYTALESWFDRIRTRPGYTPMGGVPRTPRARLE